MLMRKNERIAEFSFLEEKGESLLTKRTFPVQEIKRGVAVSGEFLGVTERNLLHSHLLPRDPKRAM